MTSIHKPSGHCAGRKTRRASRLPQKSVLPARLRRQLGHTRRRKKVESIPITPSEFQERHSPTEADYVRLTGERHAYARRRRKQDARLWGSLSQARQDAMSAIARSYMIFQRGIGYRISRPDRIRSAPGDWTDHETEAVQTYMKWVERLRTQNLDADQALAIIVEGHSPNAVDRERRQRNGTARQILCDCLDEYCDLRGWRY